MHYMCNAALLCGGHGTCNSNRETVHGTKSNIFFIEKTGSFLSKIRQKHIVFTQKTRVKQAVFAEKLPVVVQYSIPNHQKISAASLDLSKESSQNLPYFIVSILRSFLAEY